MAASDLVAVARGAIAVGFDGATAAEAPLDALRGFGAIVLFGRNAGAPEELRALVVALRALGTPPPLIAIDQEGDRVARLGPDVVTPVPSAMALAAAGDPALTERVAAQLGRELARLGISVDFAPVADLALDPAGAAVGTRAFGDDPARAAAHAAAFARGLERGGVAATLKHFPGHGATGEDSHVALPRIAASEPTLRARDLVPFARGIAERAASLVMSAHVVAEAFDPQRPATLSRAVLTGLLREELGFGGVTATDCLEMDAIARSAGTVEGAVVALAAGADLLLISHHVDLAEAAARAIASAVEDGRIPRARLFEAHARVAALRARFTAPPDSDARDDDRDAALEAARRAVTAVRGEPRLRDGKPVTVISFEGTLDDRAARSGARASADAAPSLSAALRRRRWKSEIMRVPVEPDADDLELLLEHVSRLGEREFVLVTRDAYRRPSQRDAVARVLAAAPEALIVAARGPWDATLWPGARRLACIYGDRPPAFDACADVLSGRAPARGAMPVRLGENAAVR